MRKWYLLLCLFLPFLTRGADRVVESRPNLWDSTTTWQIGYKEGESYLSMWLDHNICSGSGSCTLTSMSGYSSGDRAVIMVGTYTFMQFSSLNNISIVNANTGTSKVTLNGTMALSSLTNVRVLGNNNTSVTYGFVFISTTITAISTGHLADDEIGYMMFDHTGQLGIDFNNQGEIYDGTRASFNAVNVKVHDWRMQNAGPILQGSFAGDTTWKGSTDSIQLYNITSDSTVGDGDCIYGNGLFDFICHDIHATNTALNPSGDRGFFDIAGSWMIWNVFRYGGYGYLIRGQGCGLNGVRTCYVFNCFDGGTFNYGTIDARNNVSDTTTGTTPPFAKSCNQYYDYMTAGNKQANFYTAPFMVLGQMLKSSGYQIGMYNNLLFNTQTNSAYAGGNHISFQAFSDAMTDSAKNYYFANPITSGIFGDTINFELLLTGFPINAGVIIAIASIDHKGTQRPQGSAPDIGWEEAIILTPSNRLKLKIRFVGH